MENCSIAPKQEVRTGANKMSIEEQSAEYIRKYMKKHNVSYEEALTHRMVKNYLLYLKGEKI